MRRTILFSTVALFALALLAPTIPAGAITNGEPDSAHPNVGALLTWVDWPDDGAGPHMEFWCSGSLLAEDEFLTAGHCGDALDGLVGEGLITEGDVYVSFAQDLQADPEWLWGVLTDDLVPVTDWVIDPAFRCNLSTCYHDLAVLHLAQAQAIDPIELPDAKFLDQEAAGGGLRRHLFVNVGYGVNGFDRSRSSPNASFEFDGLRKMSTSPFMALTKQQLFLLQNVSATGGGGICAGDSGSPVFFAEPGEEFDNLAVGITTSGDPVCESLSQRGRLDIEAALPFLENHDALS
jgi:predicted outer membrane repeat protein